MPVVLMATMWLLLVNTVNSTGQWYFPGEEAHTQGQRAGEAEPCVSTPRADPRDSP